MAYRRRAYRKFSRRPRRTRFFRSRRSSVRRRIISRALSRRPRRPEIKYATYTVAAQDIASEAAVTQTLTPQSMSNGPSNGQRIGNEIMFRKVYARFYVRDNSGTTPVTAPVRQQYTFRIIFWSPRVDATIAGNYMQSLNPGLGIPDYNTVTVYSDQVMSLSPPYLDITVGTGPLAPAAGSAPYQRNFTKKFMFPRRVKFGAGSDQIDGEQYSLYFTIYASTGPIRFACNANTYYTDS